ncbi:hypothetical protein EKK58_10995 [Candidatus Dependentiae bacterium]|nr:MAG: hypothetical protein EKK58_10995 [Candidatus Dependentiae bacterium]
MKNVYFLIFISCLISSSTNTMITYNQSNTDADYYNLQYMPEDVLKEIAIQESGTFSLDDLKTAKYYKECLAENRTPSKTGAAMIDASNKYANVIKKLSVVNKLLYETLTDSRTQLNAIPEEKALLKLSYFDEFYIQLPELTYNYYSKNDKVTSNLSGRIVENTSRKALIIKGLMLTTIESSVWYNFNERQNMMLPELMSSLTNDKSLENANRVLEKLSEEGFNNSKPNIQKYITVLTYFNDILQSTGSCGLFFGGPEMSAYFKLWALPAKETKETIPYLLIKNLLTDAE